VIEETGSSSRDAAKSEVHYLLRAQLVADLLGQAEAVVVLPRPRARAALRELIGTPFTNVEDGRVHTIAEGISLAEIDHASSELAEAGRDGGLPSVANAPCSPPPSRPFSAPEPKTSAAPTSVTQSTPPPRQRTRSPLLRVDPVVLAAV
jgi:hypothetical protein